MSGDSPKKKRLEGLIHFQDPLKQAFVCLQASLGTKFLTESQAPFLKDLAKTREESSYLLLSPEADSLPNVSELRQIQDQHMLCHVRQLATQKATASMSWFDPHHAKVNAWIDSSDPIASSCLTQLMGLACSPRTTFDLSDGFTWGSIRKAKPDTQNYEDFFREGLRTFLFCAARQELFQAFLGRAANIFRQVQKVSLVGDGLSISLLLEGSPTAAWKDLAPKVFGQFVHEDAPFTAVNYRNRELLQCMIVTPTRLPLKNSEQIFFKGIVLCRDMKLEKGSLQTMKAS